MLPGHDHQMRVRGLMCPELVEGHPADFDKLSPHETHKQLTMRLVS
jgi:hypothetical protein